MAERKPYDSAHSAPTTRMDAVVPPSGDVFRIGEILGDTYEIRGLLGEGGMGQVYDAFDVRLQRTVAIKVAWPNIDASSIRKEAQALAAIRHPSVIAVYACGEHKNNEYVVMERVSGVNLETHIRRRISAGKPFPIAEALIVLAQIADGLAVVHQAGIAHRDVKPDNVMLAPGSRTVLMDFGVFVPEFDAAAHASASGSPAYMAPETIAGNVGSGGGFLVDVYAFGVLAFEVLTGVLPFPGATAREVLMSHLAAEVPRVKDRRADVPPMLDDLVAQLMSKDPFERPQGMEEVSHRLRRLRISESGEPGPISGRGTAPPSARISTGRITVKEIPVDSTENTKTQTRRKS
jgi:eukaryotic-like serine/threonine-protein kinase